MIAIEAMNMLIVTPPKNASSSLHTLLCGATYGGVYIEGPMPGPEPVDIEAHTLMIPRRWSHLQIFVVIRDAYARAISLFLHDQKFNSFRGDFLDFARDKLLHPTWWYQPNSYFIPSGKLVHFLNVKSLASDLFAAGITCADADLPRDNQLSAALVDPGSLYEGNEVRALVNYWAREDFSRFGFQMIGHVSPIDQATSVPVYQKWRLHQ